MIFIDFHTKSRKNIISCFSKQKVCRTIDSDMLGKESRSILRLKQMKELLDMFLTFARVGVLTFGGGYAMLPILQREVVENKHWATDDELMDYYAIGQCTPGVIAVNTATFIGYKKHGIIGAITATLGVVFPSLVIITLIAALISNFADLPIVKNAFAGIRVCVCVLILNAVIKLFKKSVMDIITLVLFAIAFFGTVFTDLSPIVFVLIAGAGGICANITRIRKGKPLRPDSK